MGWPKPVLTGTFLSFPPSLLCRSQGKKEEAVILLRNSIKYGPEFADAYSSLASLLAEQVKVIAWVLVTIVHVYALQLQSLLRIPTEHPHLACRRGSPTVCRELSGCVRDDFFGMGGNWFAVSNYTHMMWLWMKSLLKLWVNTLSAAPHVYGEVLIHCTLLWQQNRRALPPQTHMPT